MHPVNVLSVFELFTRSEAITVLALSVSIPFIPPCSYPISGYKMSAIGVLKRHVSSACTARTRSIPFPDVERKPLVKGFLLRGEAFTHVPPALCRPAPRQPQTTSQETRTYRSFERMRRRPPGRFSDYHNAHPRRLCGGRDAGSNGRSSGSRLSSLPRFKWVACPPSSAVSMHWTPFAVKFCVAGFALVDHSAGRSRNGSRPIAGRAFIQSRPNVFNIDVAHIHLKPHRIKMLVVNARAIHRIPKPQGVAIFGRVASHSISLSRARGSRCNHHRKNDC